MLSQEQKDFFWRHGYLALPGLAPVELLDACQRRIEKILGGGEKSDFFVRYDDHGHPVMYRVPQLAKRDKDYDALARQKDIWQVVQDLIGPADVFRDLLFAKPPKKGYSVVYHQDAAYWDVKDRNRSMSAWIAMDDAPREAGCLQFIDASHKELVRHDIYFRGRKLPDFATNALRRAISLTGTGDNPKTGAQKAFWKVKNGLLGHFSKVMPSINDLNWLQAKPDASKEVVVPAKKGDVIFFHGLLLHASGANTSPNPRRAYIVTYAGQ